MDSIIVITQNVKLDSLSRIKELLMPSGEKMILSTQFLFENEREKIDKILGFACIYKTFADILTDNEREACDKDAFCPKKQGQDVFAYYEDIKILKNKRLIEKLLLEYSFETKIIVADDLGISIDEWLVQGFKFVQCEYYHTPVFLTRVYQNRIRKIITENLKKILRKLFHCILLVKKSMKRQIFVAYKDGVKYLFYGSLNRISYRIDLEFKPAGRFENIKYLLNNWGLIMNDNTIRLSSFHEGYHIMKDSARLNVKLVQDGYLPSNYSSNYLYFYGHNTEFYTWDNIGCNTFKYHHLPYKIMPVRKKLYIPTPNFPQKVKKVLCVASGSGDWTAVKNRSDDDMMVWAFGRLAKALPQVEFIYRCHPVWIHPLHSGVNSINRVAEYISWLKLPNLRISCNIPNANDGGKFTLSYKRSSFEEDLKDVDIVFGEHSIAMLDAAFKNILFSSCNMTGHRNYFEDITKLGFPHCESVEEMIELINSLNSVEFHNSYNLAIKNYNEMTDIEV